MRLLVLAAALVILYALRSGPKPLPNFEPSPDDWGGW